MLAPGDVVQDYEVVAPLVSGGMATLVLARRNGPGGFRIQHILVTNGQNNGKDESAQFDWESGKIDVVRKGKSKQLELPMEIYDYQSIHMLAASMVRQNLASKTVSFYRKGRLRESQMAAGGDASVDVNGTSMPALIFEQSITDSSSTVRRWIRSTRSRS